MFTPLKYGFKVLKISYKANGVVTLISLFNKVYLGSIYPFIQVYLLARFLDLIENGLGITFSSIKWIVIAYLLATVFKIILGSYDGTIGGLRNWKIDNYVELEIAKKLTELDPAVFENPKFQVLLAQMGDVKFHIKNYIDKFSKMVDAGVKVIVAIFVLLPAFPIFIPIIMLFTLPSFFVYKHNRKLTLPFTNEKKGILQRTVTYIKNLLSSDSTSKEIAIFENGQVLVEKLKKSQDKFIAGFGKVVYVGMKNVMFADMFQFVSFVITQAANVKAVMRGALGVGDFTLYFQQTFNLAQGTQSFLNHYSRIYMTTKFIDKYYELMEYPRFIKVPETTTLYTISPSPPTIEFKNASFAYPGTKRKIFNKFSLKINPGEKVALVGENGAGKTTMIKLILRFYDVTSGELLVNGVNIKNIDLNEWHQQIGALFQDFIKYNFTFGENVYFGNLALGKNTALINEAIKMSGAKGYVDKLPKGLNQVVGKMFESGVDLSGGQWQKLALARAFYRNAPVLILDEPTSAIDAKAEAEIFERVQKLQRDKTVIIISHRFSTVRNADRIVVVNDGRILEEGDHNTLMRKKGLYEELFTIQAEGYR